MMVKIKTILAILIAFSTACCMTSTTSKAENNQKHTYVTETASIAEAPKTGADLSELVELSLKETMFLSVKPMLLTASPTIETVTMTTAPTRKSVTTTTTTGVVRKIEISNLIVETISVSCIKVSWDCEAECDVEVTTTAPFAENIHFEMKNGYCYITGLRENSEYNITVIPKTSGNDVPVSSSITERTEQVEVVQGYEKEEGWTNCFAGEKASGLTLMPSVGAIQGTVVDPVTNTGVRRNEYGDYCCAMGQWYGEVGDRFLIELENGIQFTVAICDSKGMADDADGDGFVDGRFHWFGGEGNGKCIVEFIYDDKAIPNIIWNTGTWGCQEWNGLDLRANIASIQMIDYGNPIEY